MGVRGSSRTGSGWVADGRDAVPSVWLGVCRVAGLGTSHCGNGAALTCMLGACGGRDCWRADNSRSEQDGASGSDLVGRRHTSRAKKTGHVVRYITQRAATHQCRGQPRSG